MTDRERQLEARVAELERKLAVERQIKVGQYKQIINTVRARPDFGRHRRTEPPIDTFLRALADRGFEWKPLPGDRYACQCPAHDGGDLNLVVTVKPDRLLVKCWSRDCDAVAIVESLGLRLSSLFGDDFGGAVNPSLGRAA